MQCSQHFDRICNFVNTEFDSVDDVSGARKLEEFGHEKVGAIAVAKGDPEVIVLLNLNSRAR